MKIFSWGNYPKHNGKIISFNEELGKDNFKLNSIPYGNGRSYGDSCISDFMIDLKNRNHFLKFDESKGFLTLQSGVLLKEIIDVFMPKGWFLKINPGTKLITIGGAIASDVHGKNHHIEGAFSECVQWIKILLPRGDVIKCSKSLNKEWFLATCGGMGLTGIILEACIELKKINSSYINQTIVKTKNLKETFQVFESIKNEPYSVAWIDCLSKGNKQGRSLVMFGDFINNGELTIRKSKNITIPFFFPPFILNTLSVKMFNALYYGKVFKKISSNKTYYDSFFFPLDKIDKWNRIYGKKGFTQYQFILPINESFNGLGEILTEISNSGKGSFLAVLKLYGKENENYLSFPIEGYSLALDFKMDKGILILLEKLDKIVTKYNGRIYLTKDVRVSKETFEKGYPKINLFRSFREKEKLNKILNSLQSKRVGI